MRRRHRVHAGLFAVGLLASGLSGAPSSWAAHRRAEKRAALTQATGSSQIERDLLRILGGDVSLVAPREAARVQAELGNHSVDVEADAVRLATRLHVAVLIAATAKKEGSRWQLRLVMRDGATGRVLARTRYTLLRSRVGADDARLIREDLASALGAAHTPAEPASASSSGEARPPAGATDATPDTLAVSANAEPLGERPSWRTLVEVAGGLAFGGRSYASSNPGEPKYSSSVVPGVHVEAALHPLAGRGRLYAALGFDLHYERAVGLSSNPQNAPGMSVSTTHDAFGLGLRGRWILHEDAMSPVIGARVGYGQRRFLLDTDLGVPNVSYQYVDLSVFGRLPVFSPRLALTAQLALQPVLGAGDIQAMNVFGPGGGSGFGLDLGAELVAQGRLAVRAGMSYQRFGLSFDGKGARHVDSTTDSYLGGYLLAAYLY
jgi:hypothetical protein